ncbi:acyltransferase [Candidatus Saccharibacteria bacterium]|nr:acyltransferase [Candidatus Saccharibacteria bacterium]
MKKYLKMVRGSKSYINYLKKIGCTIGDDVIIYRPLSSVVIDETRPWLIEIGNHVRITSGVTILTHDYSWSVLKVLNGEILGAAKKVKIGDNVFIGVKSTIMGGVSIGNNVVIGANSLVTKDIPDNVVVAGNPARVIYSIEEYRKKRLSKQLEEAIELTIEFYKKYNKWPNKEKLREFIWLFEDRDSDITKDPVFLEIGSLGNNFDKTKEEFYKSNGKFKNFDAFINHCKKVYRRNDN